MAAKSMIWMFVSVFCTLIPMPVVLFAGLLILQRGGLTVNGQGADDGVHFLDQKELEVKWIAGNATLNDGDCSSLASCSAECSRATCQPLSGESLQCISLRNSEFNNTCPSGCRNMMLVDYSRSFVNLPGGASATSLQTEVARDVCLQRRLDSTFKTVSVTRMYSKAFFGSTSGAFRSFPGNERRSDELCASYDPRRRPWYLNGISVSRDVKILVDVAKSMDQVLTDGYKRPPGTTYLDVAKNMTLALLETFSPGDNVEVLSFNTTNATSLGGAFAVLSPYDFFNPGLAPLVTNVKALAASSVAGASDLNGAISRAAGSFNQIQSLKVIIVLSNGLFVVNSATFPSAALQNNRAKLMVYKLPTNDDGGDTFLQSTPFQKDICSVQGSFELLDALATLNPLYSMRSYFTYLARIQLGAASDSVTWTAMYADITLNYSVVITSYSAFGRDGRLIGVAGAEIFLDELDAPLDPPLNLTLVIQELSRRMTGQRSAPANISMTCYYQTNIGPANWSCPPLDSSGICPQSDTSSTFAERTCCGNCASRPLGKMNNWFSIVMASLSTIIIITVLCCCKRKIMTSFFPRRLQQPVEEDHLYLNLCERIVNILEKHKSTRNLLNKRQCMDLSSKLSRTIGNIREIIYGCGASTNFKPALEKLHLDLEKAKLLIFQCGKADWCRTAVFQIHNEMAFQDILLDVSLCYNAIYEQARSLGLEGRNLPEDLRQSSVFMPVSESDVRNDQVELEKRLEVLASGYKVSGRVSLKQCLARYLVERLNHSSDTNTLDTCSSILWAKENVPTEIWGNSDFLGGGSGASGVCKTTWMGIPCAKKVFHVRDPEQLFLKEASILAHFKHPCVVNFICCGNGPLNGDRFIAMELMDKSLSNLIDAQGEDNFSLPVVVDIMVQIARGMCYLHGQGVAHRDLKPQNVVVNTLASPDENYYYVKLVDFGMSKTKVEVLKSNSISFPGVGTTRYKAPEVHREAHPDGEGRVDWFKADAFSFAMTCAHMLTLTIPFKDIQLSKIYIYLKGGNRPMLPEDCPQELNTLLEDCWTTDPQPRPTFGKILRRLEAFRFKILRGYPTYQPSLEERSDAYINVKITEYNNTFSQRQSNANPEVVIGRMTTDEIEEIEDMMVVSDTSIQGEITPHTSIEMTQKIS